MRVGQSYTRLKSSKNKKGKLFPTNSKCVEVMYTNSKCVEVMYTDINQILTFFE